MKSDKDSDKVILAKIGKHLAELRKSRGLTQRQLGEKIFAGEKTISKWERAMLTPDITMIKTLAEFYNVSCDELLSGEKRDNYSGNETIDAINIYTKQAKNKTLKKTIIIILTIIIFFITVFLIDRHYRWKVEEFQTNGEFNISGYMFSNAEETKVIIKDFYFRDKNAGYSNEEKTYWLKLSLYSNDKEICITQNDFEEKKPLYEILHNYNYVCESDKRLNLNDLSLHVEYYINMEKNYREIKLKG